SSSPSQLDLVQELRTVDKPQGFFNPSLAERIESTSCETVMTGLLKTLGNKAKRD
ncbi:MAG: hypothetical protein IMF18_03980, partial [Proteobacteria bacterium]|nr:hypothetical protein [Pseudomonadota bacterium]